MTPQEKGCGLLQNISQQYTRIPPERLAFLSLNDEAFQETLLNNLDPAVRNDVINNSSICLYFVKTK
jgi:hypothetical protein